MKIRAFLESRTGYQLYFYILNVNTFYIRYVHTSFSVRIATSAKPRNFSEEQRDLLQLQLINRLLISDNSPESNGRVTSAKT